jgi:parallel beta-helix repeat protein
MITEITPTDGMVITQDTTFAPGVYFLPNGLTIGADDVTVDGNGALIVSNKQENVAIHAEGRRNVRVHNLSISGFYHGLRFDECTNVTVEKVKVRDTWEIEGIDTFLYLWLPIEQVYGAAILLHRVTGGAVRDCDFQHQLNGVLHYGVNGVTVERVNASFNSGWGVYMSASNECTIADNQLDFCNRLYRRPEDGSIRVEADASGIVMVKGSSRNQILRNSCLCGGDGIFVAGYEHPGVHESCSDNLFEDNDCRLSPNNAIESTFSRGNIFRRNNCSRSNYGFWMGYSWDNVLEDNEVDFNRWVGIAAEHAHGFVIRNNRITQNGEGLRLWTRGGEVVKHFPGWELTYDVTAEDNTIEANRVGINAYTDAKMAGDGMQHDLTFRNNAIRDNRIGAQFERVQNVRLEGNTFETNVVAAVRLVGEPAVEIVDNQYMSNQADEQRA